MFFKFRHKNASPNKSLSVLENINYKLYGELSSLNELNVPLFLSRQCLHTAVEMMQLSHKAPQSREMFSSQYYIEHCPRSPEQKKNTAWF